MERTFAALPPAHGRGFAQSWWGRAWVRALEESALDGEQVRTGRRLARAGAVGAVSVRPGRITAVVRDRDGTGHRADVLLPELSGEDWDRFVGMAVERAGHVAALLDHEMPPHLVEDAAAAGVELLPGTGDLEPECDCGAWDHCGHSAALCYQVARLLDQDPFVLLLVRGRGERAVRDALQGPGSPPAEGTSPAEGVDAADAYATADVLPPLPGLPGVPEQPGVPPSLDTDTAPGPGVGVEPAALSFLASRTAAEAHRLLVAALSADHGQRPLERASSTARDAVRLAADGPAPSHAPAPAPAPEMAAQMAVRLAVERAVVTRLAAGSGHAPEDFAVAVRAWRLGGADALAVLEEEWAVEGETLARARAALETAWDEGEQPLLRARSNRWTVTGAPLQLRLGTDGRWWPYREEDGRWVPAGEPTRDPATALASATPAAGNEP
ncbi:SWIM zinc finger family protein [Streptomyces sp. JW3]|uniref:SWIM zinc finger family protein n=1 Tax=Streptomyces sp. JW3 TaxID=3456955 RepID=UPI003FA405FC